MEKKGAATLKALIAFYHEEEEEELTRFLKEQDQKAVNEAPFYSRHTLEGLLPTESSFQRIHYSWVLPVISRYPKELQPFFLSALPDPIPARLRKVQPKLPEVRPLTPTLRRFFSGILYQALTTEEALPPPFIPATDLSPLLKCSKNQLLTIIDYLGIWDLAEGYRQIIDKELLKTIVTQLSPKKREYLQLSVKTHPSPSLSGSLPLHGLNGDASRLQKLLHRRGLRRLGIALVDRPESMRWHITHTLDSGRAQILAKYFATEESPEAVSTVTSQVLNVIKFLNENK